MPEAGAGDAVDVKIHLNAEWPSADELAKADTILIYADGGGGHPALQEDHLAQLGAQMKRGCGYVCLHYAVEVPNDKGAKEFTEWLGGYFAPDWSVNPHWTASFKEFPKLPISNGVKPFSTTDEWYFHMRFKEGMAGVTPVLTDVPRPARWTAKTDRTRAIPRCARKSLPRSRNMWRGRCNGPTVGAGLDSQAATSTRTGGMTISASWC
jgi:hypothetical protein